MTSLFVVFQNIKNFIVSSLKRGGRAEKHVLMFFPSGEMYTQTEKE